MKGNAKGGAIKRRFGIGASNIAAYVARSVNAFRPVLTGTNTSVLATEIR